MINGISIETRREGNVITKICVEDMYKTSNKIIEELDKLYNDVHEVLDSINKDYTEPDGTEWNGELIIGVGKAIPCEGDKFDEETGNEIAFRKAKLNANIKKLRKIYQIQKLVDKYNSVIGSMQDKLWEYIDNDIDSLTQYNPDFAPHI